MSALAALLDERQITLYMQDGALKFRAPRGAVTPDVRQAIKDHKAELVARIQREELASEGMEIFASALAAIELGKPLGRLYQQVREYLRKELSMEHFNILEIAYKENNEHAGNQREIS